MWKKKQKKRNKRSQKKRKNKKNKKKKKKKKKRKRKCFDARDQHLSIGIMFSSHIYMYMKGYLMSMLNVSQLLRVVL